MYLIVGNTEFNKKQKETVRNICNISSCSVGNVSISVDLGEAESAVNLHS